MRSAGHVILIKAKVQWASIPMLAYTERGRSGREAARGPSLTSPLTHFYGAGRWTWRGRNSLTKSHSLHLQGRTPAITPATVHTPIKVLPNPCNPSFFIFFGSQCHLLKEPPQPPNFRDHLPSPQALCPVWIFSYLFIWLPQVLAAARGIFSLCCSLQYLSLGHSNS